MVSYRVMNELTIYLAVLLDNAEEDGEELSLDVCKQFANTAIDRILLMKILPRVEGDDEMFRISERSVQPMDSLTKQTMVMNSPNLTGCAKLHRNTQKTTKTAIWL